MDELATSPTGIGALIVDSTDFTTAAGRSEVTLVGIRGWLSIATSNTSSPDTLYMSIVKKDQDESSTAAPMNPSALLHYIDEDILWTAGFLSPALQTAAGIRPGLGYLEVNVKAKRKLATGQDISLQIASSAGSAQTVSGVLRAVMLIN